MKGNRALLHCITVYLTKAGVTLLTEQPLMIRATYRRYVSHSGTLKKNVLKSGNRENV